MDQTNTLHATMQQLGQTARAASVQLAQASSHTHIPRLCSGAGLNRADVCGIPVKMTEFLCVWLWRFCLVCPFLGERSRGVISY